MFDGNQNLLKMKKGKLIVIDGADGSGKATQTSLLVEKLRNLGHQVETIDFPRREAFFGGFIYRCLEDGECGDFKSLDPKIASVLYAADRFVASKKISEWLNSGITVVADRYVSANQIHQGGKIQDETGRKNFLTWLDEMEHVEFGIPRPDLVCLLDVPYSVSLKLINERNEKEASSPKRRSTDQHEMDPEHQIHARESAIKMLIDDNWVRIGCSDDGENILPRDVIHEKVLKPCLALLGAVEEPVKN